MRLVSYHTRDHAGVGVMVDDWRFVSLNRAAPESAGEPQGDLEAGPLRSGGRGSGVRARARLSASTR